VLLTTKIILSRTLFSIGFLLSLLFFGAANTYSYIVAEPPCCDMFATFGYPLALGRYGGYVGRPSFILSGLVSDVVICLVASVISGMAFGKALPRSFAQARCVKAWHTRTRL
jgi:hypothetical protein